VDVVLVGLPGSGKSVVGRRLAHRHGAAFIDIDEEIESGAGRSIPDIFATDGEAYFRALERAAIVDLGPADPARRIRRVIATGGGAVVDPRNRWALYRGRAAIWLDGRPEVLAQRLRRSPNVRPLVAGRDPIGTIRDLGHRRSRFYAAARIHQAGVAEVRGVLESVEGRLADLADRSAPRTGADGAASAASRTPSTRVPPSPGVPDVPDVPGVPGVPGSLRATRLLVAATPIGRIVLGDGIAAEALAGELEALGARRAIVVSEPGAWEAVGKRTAAGLRDRGWEVVPVLLPQGEDAKRLSVVEGAARELARLRVERSEPLVALGGGALGDTAGFLAATYLRGVPFIQVPTTLVAQVDSAIGGKTGVDLPEGKNLLGAFHQPAAVIIDVAMLRTLPERHLRAALGEAVKMGALGDERLFEALEQDGAAIARGAPDAFESGAVAEVVERAGWAKVEVVTADERERDGAGGRITLNLGHSLGHAVEAAAGFGDLLHGEAVAYGLRAACRIGVEMGVTPETRAARIGALLDRLGLATEPLPYPLEAVLGHLATDKKHAAGRLRWVLPTATGVVVRDDVAPDVVERAAAGLLAAGRTA
jgi:shikimate kinase/3-dehydroquinate synthase